MEKVCTVPEPGTSTQRSVGRKHRSQNIRGGTSTRPHPVHSRPRVRPSPSPRRNPPIASPASHS